MDNETQFGEKGEAPTTGGTITKAGKLNIQQRVIKIEDRLEAISKNFSILDKSFGKLEKNIDKTNTFMMWAMGIAIGVFIGSGILVALDYYHNNEERYDKFVDKILEIESNFYSKDELKGLIEENNKNSKILNCIKNKGYFTACF